MYLELGMKVTLYDGVTGYIVSLKEYHHTGQVVLAVPEPYVFHKAHVFNIASRAERWDQQHECSRCHEAFEPYDFYMSYLVVSCRRLRHTLMHRRCATGYVNVYDVGQAYGGPEEGGWWFETGTCIAAIPVQFTQDSDVRLAEVLINRTLTPRYEGERPLHQGGSTMRVLFEREMGTYFPKERPHYE